MKLIKKILKYIGNALLVALFLLCLYAVTISLIFKQAYVNIFGYTFFVVASGSMADTININDIVIVKINDEYNVNDIITYENEGYFITHRVISITENEIVTKGDANNTSDELISKNSVIGRVVLYFSLQAVFKIVGAIITILLIILAFNFQTIFKNHMIKKSRKNVRSEGLDNKLIIGEFVELLNKRKRLGLSTRDNTRSMVQLRYLTKSIELTDVKEFDLLEKLLNSYDFNNLKEGLIDKDILLSLKDENLKTYTVLMLKSITYEDTEIFDILFYLYRKRIYKKYLNVNYKKTSH